MEFYKKKHSPKCSVRPKPQSFVIKAQCSPETKEEEKCVLELKPFAAVPHLAFDKVAVGTSKTCTLFMFNPAAVKQLVCIEKFPFGKGFEISDVNFSVPPCEEISIPITWTPDKSFSCRESVLFKSSAGVRSQVYFHGSAHTPKKKKKKWNSKAIQKSPRRIQTLPDAELPVTFEEKKENIDFGYQKNVGFTTFSTPNFQQSRQIPLQRLDELPDSPTRRQSCAINSMFKTSCAESDIGNFCLPINLIKDKNILQEMHIKFNENHASNSEIGFQNSLTLDQSSQPECPHEESRNVTSLKEELMKSDENHIFLTPVNENHKTFFLPRKNQEIFWPLNKNPKTTQIAVVNPNLQKGSNVNQLIQAETNRETFNDSLENPALDLSTESIGQVHPPCTEDLSTLNLVPHNDETYTNENQSLFSVMPSNSDTINSFLESNMINSSNLRDPFYVDKTVSSVAFEVSNINAPNLSEDNLNLPHVHSSKQSRVTKPKKINETLPKKPVRTLKLSKTVAGASKNKKDKNITSSNVNDCSSSKSLPPCLSQIKSKSVEKVTQWNPYANSNAYFDAYWMEKQEAAFTNWLNFILTPIDDLGTEDVKVNSAAIWVESMKDAAPMRAPSKEELSYKTYTAVKQLNQLRKAACNLYQSEELREVIKKIEKEVDTKKILIRKDRALHADLGIKKDLLEMLLSYNPLWLRIGLETIYGELICMQNNDIVALSRFIIQRFLGNPDIEAKFAYSTVINYYKPGYEDSLKCFVLKKFILLVYFLDVAKRKRLIRHNPCLFCKHAKYKNSRSLLLTFSREYLSGEGDLTKHLRYLGCVVQHEQMPLEEFDYAVRNIAVDLRCGLRLGRVVEILLQDWSIFKALRANTLNRLAKIHNNEVILQALEKASVQIEGNIGSRDIVDGHREKTLNLLWQIIFKTQISKFLNLELLKKENSYLKRSLKLKADVATFNALQSYGDVAESFEMGFLNSKLYKENEAIQQLFQWCQNVCAHYGVKVLNFTTSFSDGRALCFIIHHYFPNLLPQNKICKETTCLYFEMQMEAAEEENCPFGYGEITPEVKNKLMKNERDNVDLAFQKFQEIGQIPILSFPSHVRNKIPDEKVVIILMSYVNMRFMELSVEIRAARTILLAYRKWCLRRKQAKLKIQIAAVIKIQKYWRNYLMHKRRAKEEAAAICIQLCWRMFAAKKELERLKHAKHMRILNQKASIIQAAYRKFRASRYQQKHIDASILLQSHIRKWLQRKKYIAIRSSAIKIQLWWRARLIGKEARLLFLTKKQLVVLLQSHVRRVNAQKEFRKKKESAILIQRNLRRIMMQRRFLALKFSVVSIENWWANILLARKVRQQYIICQQAVTKIQATWRMYLHKKHFRNLLKAVSVVNCYRTGKKQRVRYLRTRENIIKLQALFRKYRDRKDYCQKKSSAIKIQSVFRGYYMKKRFLIMKSSAIQIQKYCLGYRLMCLKKNQFLVMKTGFTRLQAQFRGYKIRKVLQKKSRAAVIIQSMFRSYAARKKFLSLKLASIKIQKFYCGYQLMCLERKNFLALKKGIIRLQAIFRGYKARKEFLKQKRAALCIQNAFRGYCSRKSFLILKSSAIKIQKYYRGYLLMQQEKHEILILKTGFIKLQAHFRGFQSRKEFFKLKRATITIQSAFRSYVCRKRYLTLQSSVIKIQKYYRGYMLMRLNSERYLLQKSGFTKMQALFRSYKVRKQFLKQKRAAILIQSVFRGYQTRKKYLNIKLSAVKIQRYYCGYRLMCLERQKYFIQKTGFTKLQAQFRAYKGRKEFCKKRRAAIKVQSAFRSYICRKKFASLRLNVVKIQNYYRGYKLMCMDNEKYFIQKTGFTKMQALFRSYKIRKQFLKQKRAAVLIQSAFRGYQTRKKYLNLKLSAIRIQRYYRGYRFMCLERRKYLMQKAGFTKLQAHFRAYKRRKEFCKEKRSAIKVQSVFKGYVMRKKFISIKSSVIKIQRYYRGFQLMCSDKQKYLIIKEGFIRLQALFRGLIARKEFLRKKKASIIIQKIFKGFSARKRYFTLKLSAMKIQRYYRGYRLMCLEKQKFLIQKTGFTKLQAQFRAYKGKKKFSLQKSAVILIQSLFRRHIVRKKYLALKSATVKIQKYYRAYQLMCSDKKNYLVMKTGFIKLQAVCRGIMVRNRIKNLHETAVILQSHFKRYLAMKQYQELKQKCIIIQRHYRGWLLMKRSSTKYIQMRQGTILIQAAFRSYLMRQRYLTMKRAAIKIQSFVRMIKCRKAYICARNQIIFIQQLYHFKYKMKIRKKSCIKIQACWRGYYIREKMKTMSVAAVLIQRWWRERKSCTESIVCRQWYSRLKSNTLLFQRQARIYLQNRVKAAIKIQAAWRAYKVRRSVTDKKIIRARQNIKSADSQKHKTLGYRAQKALKVLLTDESVKSIINALQTLEVCTRLSAACCERLQQSRGLTVIIQTVHACNRSVPHQEIIKFSIDILLNLCKYKKTVNSVWTEKGSLATLLEIMNIYKVKGLPISTKCTTLFWIFSQDPQKAEVLKQNSEFLESVQKFYYVLSKKKNEKDRKAAEKSILRFKGIHSFNSRESIEPDWMLGQKKMREFTDSFAAVSALMDSLGLRTQ